MRSNLRTPLVLPESTDLPMDIAEIENEKASFSWARPPRRKGQEGEREREREGERRLTTTTHRLTASLGRFVSLTRSSPQDLIKDTTLSSSGRPHLQLPSHVQPDQVFFGSRSLLEQLLDRLSYVFLTSASCTLGSAADYLSLFLSLHLQHRPVVRQWSRPRLLFRALSSPQPRSRQLYLAVLHSTAHSPSSTERPFLLRRYPSG